MALGRLNEVEMHVEGMFHVVTSCLEHVSEVLERFGGRDREGSGRVGGVGGGYGIWEGATPQLGL